MDASGTSARLSIDASRKATVAAVLLTAAAVAVLAETLRVLFPLLYHFAEEIGFLRAAGVIPLIFLAPFVTPLVRAAVGVRQMLALTVGLLLACRLALQAGSSSAPVAAVGGMTGFAALPVLAEVSRGPAEWPAGRVFGLGTLAGLLVDTIIRDSFVTWDPAWRSGVGPWVSCAALVGLTAALLVLVCRQYGRAGSGPPSGTASPTVAALGPFLALETLVLASPAFVASSVRVSLPAATAVVLLGLVVGFVALAVPLPRRGSAAAALTAGAVLAVAMGALTGAYGISGVAAAAAVVVGQGLAAWLLALACGTPQAQGGRRAGVGAGAGVASVLFVAVLLPYQIHYQLPLPFPNRALPAAAGLLLGLFAARHVRGTVPVRVTRPAFAASGAAVVAGVVPLALWVTAPAYGHPGGAGWGGGFQLVSYNIHEAVDTSGHLDPEAIAHAIEMQGADVVALQEVGRGWPLSGTADIGSWLARRLDMRLIYGPAADHQFGNAILTHLPVRHVARGRLPQGNGTMLRGYVKARVGVGDRAIDVWTTHLQHQDDTTPARIAEIETLVRRWGGASPAVLTGDMNARPGSPEMRVWFGSTNLRSAQDVTGYSGLPTCCWPAVDHRIDWILGTPRVRFSDFTIIRTQASDHLPEAVTIRVAPTQ